MINHPYRTFAWASTLIALTVLMPVHEGFGMSGGRNAADTLGEWKKNIVIEEYLDMYDFPEELISYRLEFPENSVTAEGLNLLDEHGREVPMQVSDVKTSGKYATGATVYFRTDLPRKAIRHFTLIHEAGYSRDEAGQGLKVEPRDDNTAELVADNQRVRVPWGKRAFNEGRDASEVSAPLIALRGRTGNWIGRGSFRAPEDLRVLGYDTQIEESGPLFIRYRVVYEFTGDRYYEVKLTLGQGDDHVTVDEYLNGFDSIDGVYLRFSFDGLNPDARLVMSNVGYNGDSRGPQSGPFTNGIEDDGRLPYELSLFSPNSLSVSRATAFWRDEGDDGLLFSINRPEDWITSERYIWHSRNKPENFRFYAKNGERFMQVKLAGRQRHWAISAMPRNEMIIARAGEENEGWLAQRNLEETVPGGTPVRIGAGPEVRLYQRLTDFSLDRYKALVVDFDESLEPFGKAAPLTLQKNTAIDFDALLNPFRGKPQQVSFDEFWNEIGMGGGQSSSLDKLIQYYWDWSGSLTHRFGIFSYEIWLAYANSRAGWSEEERRRARATLLFTAEIADSDNFMPHHAMLGGHPNFISEAKFDLALAAAIFPNHPRAEGWKQSYLAYLDEYLEEYSRRPDPSFNARGGRHTENISCYSLASLRNTGFAARALRKYDGTDILGDPRFEAWLGWTIDGIAPFIDSGRRRVLPIGAHSDGRQEIKKLSGILPTIAFTYPDLAAQLEWGLTDGSKGKHYPRESTLYRDYGAVLWYDHGGSNEAMLTIQQLYGSGYRWTSRSNGLLYYATGGQQWSWNDAETNGDDFDIEQLTVFNIDGQSLGGHPVDELLYNFGEAQFYRARGSHDIYKWRGVIMRRDEYVAVYDHLDDAQAEGTFQWVNRAYGYEEPLPEPDVTPVKNGTGDQLHLVSPASNRIKDTPYGAIVNERDHVIFAAEPLSVDQEKLRFKGRTGLASDGQVYLFEGELIVFNDLGLMRKGGDFGAGVWQTGHGKVAGRVVGCREGELSVMLPDSPQPGNVEIRVDGEPISANVEKGKVTFPVNITGSDGYKSFVIKWTP